MIATTLVYLDDYSDEVCPCEPTLEGWATWLAKPDRNWNRSKAAKDGDSFPAGSLELQSDIIVTKDADGKWAFSATAPADADFFAVRFGADLSWDVDSICGTMGDLIDHLAEFADDSDGTEHIAVGRWINDLIVTYHIDGEGKPSCTLERKQ